MCMKTLPIDAHNISFVVLAAVLVARLDGLAHAVRASTGRRGHARRPRAAADAAPFSTGRARPLARLAVAEAARHAAPRAAALKVVNNHLLASSRGHPFFV